MLLFDNKWFVLWPNEIVCTTCVWIYGAQSLHENIAENLLKEDNLNKKFIKLETVLTVQCITYHKSHDKQIGKNEMLKINYYIQEQTSSHLNKYSEVLSTMSFAC